MHKRLEAFLFRLARDHVPTGIIEEHVRAVEKAHGPVDDIAYQGEAAAHLGGWAEHVALRLLVGGETVEDPRLNAIRAIIDRPYDAAENTRRIAQIRALLQRAG